MSLTSGRRAGTHPQLDPHISKSSLDLLGVRKLYVPHLTAKKGSHTHRRIFINPYWAMPNARGEQH